MSIEVVINARFGGFGLSEAARLRYEELSGVKFDYYGSGTRQEQRTDPILIQIVHEMGEKANGKCAKLVVVDVPKDVKWHIHEYDGFEHVAEDHRTWE